MRPIAAQACRGCSTLVAVEILDRGKFGTHDFPQPVSFQARSGSDRTRHSAGEARYQPLHITGLGRASGNHTIETISKRKCCDQVIDPCAARTY